MKIQLTSAMERDLGRDPFVCEMIDITTCMFELTHSIKYVKEVSIMWSYSWDSS